MENQITIWLSDNWQWVLLGFMVAEKIVKASPSKADDIMVDMLFKGLVQLVGKKEEEAK